MAPSTLSLIRNLFLDPGQRSIAIGVWITAYSLGGVLGPFVGGALLEFFWWGSVFLAAVPVMAMLLVVGPILLPEYKDPDAGRLDLVSAALSMAAVLSIIFGLKEMAQDGLSALAVIAVVAGIALGVLFVRRQLALDDPLIDLRLFGKPAFTASVMAYGLTIFVLFGSFFFLPQYLQLVHGLSPLRAGLWGVPSSIAFIVAAMGAPLLARRVRPAVVMALGLLCAAPGYLVFARLDETTGFAAYAVASILLSLGSGPVITLTNDLIIGSAPPERAGAAAGISETSAEFGGALGIAVFGSIGVAIYRSLLAGASLPDVPTQVVEGALDTLGGAMALAGELPAGAASQLIAAARDAYLSGLRLSAWLSVAGTLVLAAFVMLRLGHVPPAAGATPSDDASA